MSTNRAKYEAPEWQSVIALFFGATTLLFALWTAVVQKAATDAHVDRNAPSATIHIDCGRLWDRAHIIDLDDVYDHSEAQDRCHVAKADQWGTVKLAGSVGLLFCAPLGLNYGRYRWTHRERMRRRRAV